jgi:hypothetical protein
MSLYGSVFTCLSFLLGGFLALEFLDHLVNLQLIFKELPNGVTNLLCHDIVPSAIEEGYNFCMSLSAPIVAYLFDSIHSSRSNVAINFGFHLHLSNHE